MPMPQRNFFIDRELDQASLDAFKRVQTTISATSVGFNQSEIPHLTHVGSKFIAKGTRALDTQQLYDIIFPLPISAKDELTLGVKGLKSIQGRREKPYLVVELDDAEQRYKRENYAISSRVAQALGLRAINIHTIAPPHVSLGRVFTENLSHETIRCAKESLPEIVTFQPVCYPAYICEELATQPVFDTNGSLLKQAPAVPRAFLDTLRPTNT